MQTEPINIFARTADLAGVARLLRELHPSVAIDGPDHDWRTATVTFGRLWMKRRLTFIHDPQYHAEPNWSMQMDGMRGYFGRFPETARKQTAVMLPTTFHFSLATSLEPDLKPDGDPRFDVITAVARHLDGVLFMPSGLRDAHGRMLFGVGGESEEDPRAAWPRVIATAPVQAAAAGGHEDADEEDEDDEDEIDPPTAERVARRALALAALTARAVLEQDARAPDAAERHRELLEWVREMGIEDELEGPSPWRSKPHERSIFESPLGGMDPQAHVDSMWRSEGLAVLAWALGLYELPPHDEPADVDELWNALGLLDGEEARALLASPVLRPREEIGALRARLFALHWRLRDYTLRPQRMDFAEFARTSWFGPLDITGVALAEGDLSVRGTPIDQADPAFLGALHSAAQERHVAANWLYEGPERYSETDAST
jgi:hypothetical protein